MLPNTILKQPFNVAKCRQIYYCWFILGFLFYGKIPVLTYLYHIPQQCSKVVSYLFHNVFWQCPHHCHNQLCMSPNLPLPMAVWTEIAEDVSSNNLGVQFKYPFKPRFWEYFCNLMYMYRVLNLSLVKCLWRYICTCTEEENRKKWAIHLKYMRRVQKVKMQVLNMHNIFNVQKWHCEWIACT